MPTTREHSGRGRKLVGPRKASSRPRRKNLPTRRVKVAKKAMIRSRQPLVETKSRVQSEIALGTQIPQCKDFKALNAVFNLLPLHAYTCMEQGIGEHQMLGNSVMSRYLNAKVQIRFPGGQNLISDRHYPMELICGWIPSSTAFSTFTTPDVKQVSPSDISTFIIQRISEYFNARTDKLEFVPKHASNLRITFRRQIRANQNKANVAQANAYDQSGHIPDVMLYPKWKMNKKVFFEEGTTYGDGMGTDRRNFYPNYSWIPFMVVYSPMYAGEGGDAPLPTAKCPKVSYNVAHYYTDS